MEEWKIGDIVTGIYKTGKYVGEITDIRPMHYLVKVKAVLKHPQQGDLHNPKDSDVPLFHERRALAFNEQTNIPKQMVRPFLDEIPDYTESLKRSLSLVKEDLDTKEDNWSKRSLVNIIQLEQEYFKF
ncbi:kinase-associated lipoprotein B [Metabacillus herbersteinensis]|uniref:Kinase-associated lipoprotein B n=1 Tax=Metabacillus herbersteinensis TaxID=283816 RepID=A0ABV6GBT4_9BACI